MFSYLRLRLLEKTTWASIGAGVALCAMLPFPWDIVGVAVATIGSLVPSPGKKECDHSDEAGA